MTAMPAVCGDCARPLRDARTPARATQPGTVPYAGNGVCTSCRSRRIRDAAVPDQCDCCGADMRPRRTPEADRPGTVIHVARGLCRVCYDAERNLSKTGEMYPDISPEQHRHNLAGHGAWLAERRKRGVPAAGYQVADEPDTVTQLLAPRGKTPSQRRAIAKLVAQLESERAAVTAATRAQERRQRSEYGIVA